MNKKKPNIIFILSDDHGCWANGCYGNSEIRTPNIDKLARQGMLFENYFCTSPVCSPARASILTGKIPSQHGVHDWIGKGSVLKSDYDNIDVSRKRFVASQGKHATEDYREVPENETVKMSDTFEYQFIQHEDGENIQYLKDHIGYTDVLSDDGYICGLIGKWHLGDSKTPQKGINHWSVIGKGGSIYHMPDFYRDGKLIIEDKYITNIITEEGMSFIDECSDKEEPFYLGLHYTAPHSPWIKEDQPEDIWETYNSCSFESVEDVPVHPWQAPNRHGGFETAEGRRYMLQGYYTAVTAMDRDIGRLIDKLDEMGIREDTLIVFTSDNGMNMGHHGIWGKGNGTFPQNMYDTSVKVPMIISHPGTIAENIVEKKLFSHYDVMPTLLNYAGIDCENLTKELPGSSFSSLLKGDEYDQGEDIVVFDEYGPVRMIRSGEWKYVHRYPEGPHELYCMNEDPNEDDNLVESVEHKEILENMRGRLDNWFKKYVNSKYDGSLLPVTGDGQISIPDTLKKDKMSFR